MRRCHGNISATLRTPPLYSIEGALASPGQSDGLAKCDGGENASTPTWDDDDGRLNQVSICGRSSGASQLSAIRNSREFQLYDHEEGTRRACLNREPLKKDP